MATEFIATDPTRFGKLTGWHTAGINVAGSFVLGGISAVPARVGPSVDVSKVNGQPLGAWKQKFQSMSPRTKLMMGVG
jgi:hypothetical protein